MLLTRITRGISLLSRWQAGGFRQAAVCPTLSASNVRNRHDQPAGAICATQLPTTMQLSPEQMSGLLTPPLLRLAAIFRRHGHELRIAGGAVRDLLMGLVPHDLDLATTATPDQMKRMCAQEIAAAISAAATSATNNSMSSSGGGCGSDPVTATNSDHVTSSISDNDHETETTTPATTATTATTATPATTATTSSDSSGSSMDAIYELMYRDSENCGRLRLFNTNGERHGTVSFRVDDAANFEVTTLRVDVLTDGRRAAVRFVEDWRLDAERRDLTVNALFLDLDGRVYDYCGGCDDIAARRVRFVGRPADRIAEDYLRILRYFRFFGRLAAEPEAGHEPQVLEAISRLAPGLARISGERLHMELRQILAGRMRRHLVPLMVDCRVTDYLGLPALGSTTKEQQQQQSPNLHRFHTVCAHCDSLIEQQQLEQQQQQEDELQYCPHPMTLLTSLLNTADQLYQLHERLKLSALERDMALFIIEHRASTSTSVTASAPASAAISATCGSGAQDCGARQLLRYKCLLAAAGGTGGALQRYGRLFVHNLMFSDGCGLALVRELDGWRVPAMAVTGADVVAAGVAPGRAVGHILIQLRHSWVQSEFAMSRDQLLELVPPLVDQMKTAKSMKKRKYQNK